MISRILSITGNPGELAIMKELIVKYGESILDKVIEQKAIGGGRLYCLHADLNGKNIERTASDIIEGRAKDKLTDDVLREKGYTV